MRSYGRRSTSQSTGRRFCGCTGATRPPPPISTCPLWCAGSAPRASTRSAARMFDRRASSGKAVMYACSDRPDCRAVAQVLKQNLRAIGIQLEIKQLPFQVIASKLDKPSEPWDLVWLGQVAPYNDPASFFDGLTYYSHLKSPLYDRQLKHAAQLSGLARYR